MVRGVEVRGGGLVERIGLSKVFQIEKNNQLPKALRNFARRMYSESFSKLGHRDYFGRSYPEVSDRVRVRAKFPTFP